MKYSSNNKPTVCMMTQSTCYKQTRTFNPLGVLWHCTGANNPNLWRYVQPSDNDPNRAELLSKIGKNPVGTDWNHTYVEAGLNFWIGKLADGTVTTLQTMPWNYRPWGCGSGPKGSCNDTHIQFEICEDALTDKDYFEACYKEACEMTAYLCQMYGINPNGKVRCGSTTVPTILCHKDSCDYGVGSAHGDVYNWFNRYGRTMDDVRRDITALLTGSSIKPVPSQKSSSQEDFIERIAPLVQKIAQKYGITCPSAVIAQACLESAYGTSNKAKYHNYFGLKYREGRVSCHSGVFTDGSSEQLSNGSYIPITTSWYKFDSMEKGVEGYFQFINTANYANVKGISDPLNYLTRIREDGYATSLTYVTNVMNVVKKYDLTKYDGAMPIVPPTPQIEPVVKVVPKITYAVKTRSGIGSDVKDGAIAGDGKDIVAIKVGVDVGKVEYRVHAGGRWLPRVSGCDWTDYEDGYAGDDRNAIDAIQIYYTSDTSKTDLYEAVYKVRVGSAYLPEIHDTNWEAGDGDNTAGMFGVPFDQIRISLERC